MTKTNDNDWHLKEVNRSCLPFVRQQQRTREIIIPPVLLNVTKKMGIIKTHSMNSIYINQIVQQPETRHGPSARGTPGGELMRISCSRDDATLPVDCSPDAMMKINRTPGRIHHITERNIRAPEYKTRAPDENDVHLVHLSAKRFGSHSLPVPQHNRKLTGGPGTLKDEQMNFNTPGETLSRQQQNQQMNVFHMQLRTMLLKVTKGHRLFEKNLSACATPDNVKVGMKIDVVRSYQNVYEYEVVR